MSSNVLKYKSFMFNINESDYGNSISTVLDLGSTVETIKEKCKFYDFDNDDHKIYRGLPKAKNHLMLIEPSKGQRRSSGMAANNYYTYIIDSSKAWSDYPKREKSCIGINSESVASRYGELYIVIPFDNAEFGMCPKNDLLYSFKYMKEKKSDLIDFNDMLKEFYNSVFNEYLDDSSLDKFLACMSRFDNKVEQETLKKRIAKIRLFFMKEIWDKYLTQNKNKLSFIDFIGELVFNPAQNGFKTFQWNKSVKVPKGKEVWTESNVILVADSYYNDVRNAVKKVH